MTFSGSVGGLLNVLMASFAVQKPFTFLQSDWVIHVLLGVYSEGFCLYHFKFKLGES